VKVPLLAAVGPLQFEVVQYRLQSDTAPIASEPARGRSSAGFHDFHPALLDEFATRQTGARIVMTPMARSNPFSDRLAADYFSRLIQSDLVQITAASQPGIQDS